MFFVLNFGVFILVRGTPNVTLFTRKMMEHLNKIANKCSVNELKINITEY